MNDEEIYNLFGEVLQRLAGNRGPITLHFSRSPAAGAIGSVTKDLAGGLHVYVDPSMSLDAIFEVFLHEAAHVVLHAGAIAQSAVHTQPAQTFTNQARAAGNYQADETAADTLKATWLNYANKNAWRAVEAHPNLQTDPTIFKLLALKGYKP